jgi:hypothetical protein
MFPGRRFSIGGRIIVGLVLVSTIVLMVCRLYFSDDVDDLRGTVSVPLLIYLAFLCVRLVPSAYRSSRVAYILGGIAVGSSIVGLVGSSSGLAMLGATTGGILGGLIAYGLATGVISTVLAGAVLFGGLSALIPPYPRSEAFGGSLAVPGGLLGAAIIWMCRQPRESQVVSRVLAVAALFGGLAALMGLPIHLATGLAGAGGLLVASIVGMIWKPRRSQSAAIPAYASQGVPDVGIRPDHGPAPALAGTSPVEESARRRSPGTVRRIMIAVVCCAFLLSGLRRDATGVLTGMTHLLLVIGCPASGVILQRRWGGSGILGGTIAGAATFFLATTGMYTWLSLKPGIGALPEPLKQILHSAVFGATFGLLIGFLIWGVLLAEKTSEEGEETFPHRDLMTLFPTEDQGPVQPRVKLGVLAGATAYLVEGDLAGVAGQTGYPLILAAWVLLLVAFGFDLVHLLSRSLNFALGPLLRYRS